MQSREGIYHVHFMLGVAWRGAMLAAFITELYAEAERGADAQIKLSEDPPLVD
jgi:hypothetical protein